MILIHAAIVFVTLQGQILQSHSIEIEKRFCGQSSQAAVTNDGTAWPHTAAIVFDIALPLTPDRRVPQAGFQANHWKSHAMVVRK